MILLSVIHSFGTLHPWIAILATVGVFVGMQLWRRAPADILFLSALMMVTVTGVITPQQAFEGFANPAILTIAGLLAVTAGLRTSGVLDWVGRRLLGSARTERAALARLVPTLIVVSGFVLNTALVAMMMPVVIDWCRRRNLSPSRLLIPLSYLTILGGVCTLIGTSTTLVVQGKLGDLLSEYQRPWAVEAPERPQDASPSASDSATIDGEDAAKRAAFLKGLRPMTLFELGMVGAPCAVIGGLFLLFFGPRFLPDRTELLEEFGEHRREYLAEVLVQPECPLIGQTVEAAGLRHLPGLFLIEIDRDGEILTPVTPEDVLRAHDRLVFTGVVSTIVDLEKIPGLVPGADKDYEHAPQLRQQRHLTEVVLSRTSPLIGFTVKEANFRQRYNAAVVAVHRNGVRLTNKIGNIRLAAGDTLLLQTRTEFVSTYRNSRDFYLVSSVEGVEPRRHHKMLVAAGLGTALIAWLIGTSFLVGNGPWAGIGSTAVAAISIALLMILTQCLRPSEARNAIDLHMLITIAAALGLGKALTVSGAALGIADFLIQQVGQNPGLLLLVVYLLAIVFTETITNNAVAAMLLPLAVAVAWSGGYNPRPYIMAVTIAASLSFVTPIGYQTNLMVMGPGGYRPADYFRSGLPLALLVGLTAMLLIPRIWPY